MDTRRKCWEALRDAAIFPDLDVYGRAIGTMSDRGERALDEVRQSVGAGLFDRAISAFADKVRRRDVVRILGFGELLTDYAISPVGILDPARQDICRLGSCANLIVTLYDHFVDTRDDGHAVVKRDWLLHSIKPTPLANVAAVMIRRVFAPEAERFMARLVSLYFRKLRHITARGHAHAPRIESAVHSLITRMYDAELETARCARQLRRSMWRQKSGLPFLVMALPSWLIALPVGETLRWHMRWTYRLGLTLGAIDDAIDFEADRARQQYNDLECLLSRSEDPQVALTQHTASIACAIGRIEREWKAKADSSSLTDPVLPNVLAVTAWSWFGGPGWRPT